MSDWIDLVYEYHLFDKTDEPEPIPQGSGSPEAYTNMWQRVWSMSNDHLTATCHALLSGYNRCDYYDRIGKIGMEEWAEAICSEMDNRGLNKFS